MKLLSNLLILMGATFLLSWNTHSSKTVQPINPLIGDLSFVNTFGQLPDENTDEDLRIKTHLSYAEKILRQKDVAGLSPEMQQKRTHLLDLLHAYWTAGIFPRNYDHDDRLPCFIDRDNKICAVGYLVEQTAGRETAEHINGKHQYNWLLDMKDDALDAWIESCGLSKTELATIQPAYGRPSGPSAQSVVASSALAGLNLGLSVANVQQMKNGRKNDDLAILTIFSGVGSITYGVLKTTLQRGFIFGGFDGLTMMDVGMGTTSLVMGTCNLIASRPTNEKKVSLNFFSYPTEAKKMGLGFSLTKRL